MKNVSDLVLRCSLIYNLFVLEFFAGEDFTLRSFSQDTGVPINRVSWALHQLGRNGMVQRLPGWSWSLEPSYRALLASHIFNLMTSDGPHLENWHWYECQRCKLILPFPEEVQWHEHPTQRCPESLKLGRWARIWLRNTPKPHLN